MKAIKYFLIFTALFIQNVFSLQAQSTIGQEFWLTFGSNVANSSTVLDFQIRIVSGDEPATVTLYFTNLNTSVTFPVAANKVYTYSLTNTQREAVYHYIIGGTTKTNHNIKITSSAPVSVYAMNHLTATGDATNILPVTTIGTDYYQISYTPPNSLYYDAYAVVATQNNTFLYHDGFLETTLEAGEVYYKVVNNADMTGTHITTNNPVAFFAVHPAVVIPAGMGTLTCLFQQLAPVNTWGKNFFVPVSDLICDRVRIVVSQDGTYITHSGGALVSSFGSQMNLNNLNAGQFVELEILSDEEGSYIQSNKPLGVCTYLTNYVTPTLTKFNAAQCWVPAIEQSVTSALVAPFIPDVYNQMKGHYALVCTPTATKDNTKVSIGGAPPDILSGGSWKTLSTGGMSFYSMPLTNDTASYYFTNQKGLIILCYAKGTDSYYYLAGSAMRDLEAAFYMNDVYYLTDTTFCNKSVNFRAEIEGQHPTASDSIMWYINDVFETSQATWNKPFENDTYEIKLVVHYENDTYATLTGTLKVQALWIKIRNVRY